MKDSGVRDEHGLELVDGLFSSPEKPSQGTNGTTNNTTISSEEDMDLGDSKLDQTNLTCQSVLVLLRHDR